jgi:3-oxoacyl-[acyl-carrier-protein] synthase-3
VRTAEAAITGLGSYLPERTVTNDDLAQRLDTSDEWIRTRTGIRERHYAAAEEATSDLAVVAARRALEDAGRGPEDVDVLIVATTTPDHPIPATAPIVAARLGVECAAFDLNAACSGFVYGYNSAKSATAAIQQHHYRHHEQTSLQNGSPSSPSDAKTSLCRTEVSTTTPHRTSRSKSFS